MVKIDSVKFILTSKLDYLKQNSDNIFGKLGIIKYNFQHPQ